MSAVRGAALLLALSGVGALAGTTTTACTPDAEEAGTSAQAASELDKSEWLEKAAKVLRNGDGIGPRDDAAALLALPKSEIVDRLMADPRFGDAVLAFDLFYLGRSLELLRTKLGNAVVYDAAIFEFPQALMAARAVVTGGDYFDLFHPFPDFIVQPNPAIASAGAGDPGERARVGAVMDGAIARVDVDRTGACAAFDGGALQATNRLRLLGFAPALQIRQLWLNPHPAFPKTVDCTAGSTQSSEALATSMRTVRSAIDVLWKRVLERRIPETVTSVADLTAVSVADVAAELPPLVSPLGSTFFTTLPSSSTNFHRKRAAYMLKTYFCDDLTPLDLPATEPGDGGESDIHASNSSCQACHYRLDPMGALFRNIGVRGRDFAGKSEIRFDDAVVFRDQAHSDYLKTWQNPDGSFRAGYWVLGQGGRPQREPGWTDADGNDLRGLWSYMGRTKQVKACLVRRLADYVLGPKQVYDREWLAEISAGFSKGPRSGAAFKEVVKALVLSKTFATHDPVKGTCYDVPAGASDNRAPCAIAHVVSSQCAGCHSSVDGPGGLDFTSWTDIGGGVFSFPHLDRDGQQLPQGESLRRMLERITSADRNLRMPLLRAMPADEFTTFRDWLTTNLENPR